jgi:hypothetical protein
MSNGSPTPWYLRYPKRWEHFRAVPFSRLKWLLIAVYLLFSIFGFYADLMSGGTQPYLIVITNVFMNGITSTLFIVVLARLPLIYGWKTSRTLLSGAVQRASTSRREAVLVGT